MHPASPALDPTACPLCGKPNLCAMEIERTTGVKQESCWCTQLDFSDELLDQVPAEAQNLSCICADCSRRGGPAA